MRARERGAEGEEGGRGEKAGGGREVRKGWQGLLTTVRHAPPPPPGGNFCVFELLIQRTPGEALARTRSDGQGGGEMEERGRREAGGRKEAEGMKHGGQEKMEGGGRKEVRGIT